MPLRRGASPAVHTGEVASLRGLPDNDEWRLIEVHLASNEAIHRPPRSGLSFDGVRIRGGGFGAAFAPVRAVVRAAHSISFDPAGDLRRNPERLGGLRKIPLRTASPNAG